MASAFVGSAAFAGNSINCGGSTSGLSCSTGNIYTDTLVMQADNTFNPIPHVTASSTGSITVTMGSSTKAALEVLSIANGGDPSGNLTGVDTQGMTVTNQGALTLVPPTSSIVTNGTVYGLFAQMLGGNAASSSDQKYGGNGGVAGQSPSEILSVTNNGNITMNLPGVTSQGGAAVGAFSAGGAGAGTTDDHNQGGAGGQSAGVAIDNAGTINVTLAGTKRFAGLLASSSGGNAADQYDGGLNTGGGSGSASVRSTGSINLNWTWAPNAEASSALYGILAQTQSGNGGASLTDGLGNGGNAGTGDARDLSAIVTLLGGGNVTVNQTGTPPAAGAGVAAIAIGGKGGNGLADEDGTSGGNGGNAGTIGASSAALQINVTDASVSTNGDQLPALRILAQGGAGAGTYNQGSYHDRNGGQGGSAGDAAVTMSTSGVAIALSTKGDTSAGIQTSQTGGAGGAGGDYGGDGIGIGVHDAGTAGNGGDTGNLSITLAGSSAHAITITTIGNDSPGIRALLKGGTGADGGQLTGTVGGGSGGGGGAGGATGKMTVALQSTTVSTQGANAFGILAQNLGNNGGDGGSATTSVADGGDGGGGGSTGALTISTDSNTSIKTAGAGAAGIVAQTASGAGGNGGAADAQLGGVDGNGASGGAAGAVTVTNGGTISTLGLDAAGIVAQSLAGGGGSAGDEAYGIFYSKGGSGGSAGSAGVITVNNTGTITTGGTLALGILAQSVGGSGGVAGSAAGLGVSLGGDSDTNPYSSNANGVNINASGSITTNGLSAIGILAQSVGGGGGTGGGSQGLVSIGGSGGKGGSGGEVTGTLTNLSITTNGDNAYGYVGQSIGGGGGNAGNADSFGLFTSVAIGQSGGDGGTGGAIDLKLSNTNISTQGTKAAGVVSQSIGGGGGTGGQAFAYTVGVGAGATVGVGGQGGTGGNGGSINTQMVGGSIKTGQSQELLTGTCTGSDCLAGMNELPVDAFGAVIQSIGGGGGLGGNATAKAAAIGIPVDEKGDQVAIPVAVAVGGSGNIAGNGGYATFAAAQGAAIETRGQGSHGVLIQSIGGGGGAGGDSSSLAAALDYGSTLPDGALSLSIQTSIALGGNGGGGGDGSSVWSALGGLVSVSGGNATFTADAPGTAKSTIETYGDYANGIAAQSIGGGGGNAGFGSGNTQSLGTGNILNVNIGLGGLGAKGGNGGDVQVQVMPTGTITTLGSGAIGVLAQSVGGGGGTSQGGSYNLIFEAKHVEPNIDVKVGRPGGAGGKGGTVDVSVGGVITTNGGDAAGVQAQSIGGGGGQGGAAGSDGSADNPVLSALDGRADAIDALKDIYEMVQQKWPSTYQLNLGIDVSVGGAGGPGNTGGPVNVTLDPTGSITTAGDWSMGIFAQSVGGGGGKGGAALATGSGWLDPTHFDLNNNVSVGGDGGGGSNGGPVTVALDGGQISTGGFGATGLFAQSVGGGGGHGANGSDGFYGTLALGLGFGGSGGGAGNGGVVTLNPSTATTIGTQGEAAFGVVLQSVGGGGGFAGAGTSVRVALANGPIPALNLTSGSAVDTATGQGVQNTSSGDGGAVTVNNFNNVGGPAITTKGSNAYGLVAQSVGGGGGIIINSQNQQQTVSAVNASIYGTTPGIGATANGGDVFVDLAADTLITTSGTGAHGLIAQSVGGGGGIIGLPGSAPTLKVVTVQDPGLTAGDGFGGTVTVTHHGTINVSGAGAIGILAQSVTGAGGLRLASDGHTVYAGGTPDVGYGAAAVSVKLTEGSVVNATGENGIGVFSQSANGSSNIVTVDGSVTAGSSSAAGIGVWLDAYTGGGMTVGSTGSITADTAILATTGGLDVDNAGTVTGSVSLNGGSFTNTGTYAAGAEFEGASLANSGTVALGGREGTYFGYDRTRFAATTFNTAYAQTPAGVLQVGANFDNLTSDYLTINGPANLDGVLRVAPRALLPNRELGVLTVNGAQSGALVASDSPVVDYETRQDGNITRVRAVAANFNAGAMQLKHNASTLAGALQRDWDQGGSSALAELYAVLDTASRQGAGAYQSRLSDLSPGVTLAPAAQMQLGMARFTGSMMSCPAFIGDAAATKEQNCVWGQVTGRHTSQDASKGSSGFDYDSVTYQVGGQKRIAPDWYMGGSFAYQNTHLSGDDHRVTGSGDSGYAGLVLKREAGPWTFSGALGGGYGSYDMYRSLNIPNYQRQAKSSPDVYSFGARLRVARTFSDGAFYVKPYVDLDATYSRMPGYKESGDALRLQVAGSDQFVLGIAPTLEIGGRTELPRGAVMRPFAYAGVSVLTEDGWKTRSRLSGASDDAGSFTTVMPTDNVIGRIGAGLQIMHADGLDFRLQYDGEFASRGTSHSGSLKLAYRF
ncbi:autotransporter outer membrane beta-barrel domain-containing protein [Achromobacter aloeverae]|nr:autotransporter outer membrane beta-barrel domain-containing protein [Achromobacter aloeverae]